jgi:hypothetical protein
VDAILAWDDVRELNDASAEGREALADRARSYPAARGEIVGVAEQRRASPDSGVGHGRKEEAWRLLADIYGWFTEGLQTRDLIAAGALLEEKA